MADAGHLTPFTQRKIARLAETALQDAGVAGVFPTDLRAVQHGVGVVERLPMKDLPHQVRAKKPSLRKRVLGALWFEARTIFIDTEQHAPRVVFTDAHEATHAMCGWHADILQLDTEDELFRHLHAGIELEANYGAGHLIFQGGRFHQIALEDQVSLRAPLALHDHFGASRHATMHYYTQEHPDAVALLVAGLIPRADGSVPIWHSVESRAFLERFGRLKDKLPGRRLLMNDGPGSPFAGIVNESRLAVDPPERSVQIRDRGGRTRRFVAEAFYNQHCQFVFVAERRATRLGRRGKILVAGI